MRTDLPADIAALIARPPIYRLLGVAEKVHGKHLNHVWKGLAGVPWVDEPGIPVFVKYLSDSAQLCIELACGLASQVLKLPVPSPALVVAELEDIPSYPSAVKTGPLILFGSLFQAPDPFLARRLSEDDRAEDYIWGQVCSDAVGPIGAAWDELVANPDRHAQNLIFDGLKWWLFDHNLALQPLSRIYATLEHDSAQARIVEHMARINQILDQLKKRRQSGQDVVAQADKLARQAKRLKILAIEMRKWEVRQPQLSEILRVAAIIVDLIALRLAPLTLFIEKRLDVPRAEALWTE
ncbi:hypothetical protein BG58_17730 [Caballeronia jiangsuensis]|nr:hypothetical protein BG58_17730 [Caballeronia jiangsuensis]